MAALYKRSRSDGPGSRYSAFGALLEIGDAEPCIIGFLCIGITRPCAEETANLQT